MPPLYTLCMVIVALPAPLPETLPSLPARSMHHGSLSTRPLSSALSPRSHASSLTCITLRARTLRCTPRLTRRNGKQAHGLQDNSADSTADTDALLSYLRDALRRRALL